MNTCQIQEQDILSTFGSFENYYSWKIDNYIKEDKYFKELFDDIEADRIIDEYKNNNYEC